MKEDNKGTKYYFDFSEVFGYFFRKKDPDRKPNINIRMMHGINKIAIVIFLLGVVFIIGRAIMRSI